MEPWQAGQSALDPAGPQAARILALYHVHHRVSAIVYALVMLALLLAVWRGGRRTAVADDRGTHRTLYGLVTAAGLATVVVLFGLLVVSIGTGRALSRLDDPDALTIQVTGYQWWWGVEYQDQNASLRVRTANEIHIPVGRPVIIKGTSTDLIPGHTTTRWLQADRPGVYRGQCAEFCGLQHAHMALLVIAEDEPAFRAWYSAQLQPAAEPADAVGLHGQQVFAAQSCVLCHTIRGTLANGMTAPDLTHLASRRTLAAGTLPNTRGHLAGWIVDPQSVKPGNHMPSNGLPPDDLNALITYLGGLR
jgi:cytochrome c oxidase subunit 2